MIPCTRIWISGFLAVLLLKLNLLRSASMSREENARKRVIYEECIDKYIRCEEWASQKLCSDPGYKEYMMSVCPLTCAVCKRASLDSSYSSSDNVSLTAVPPTRSPISSPLVSATSPLQSLPTEAPQISSAAPSSPSILLVPPACAIESSLDIAIGNLEHSLGVPQAEGYQIQQVQVPVCDNSAIPSLQLSPPTQLCTGQQPSVELCSPFSESIPSDSVVTPQTSVLPPFPADPTVTALDSTRPLPPNSIEQLPTFEPGLEPRPYQQQDPRLQSLVLGNTGVEPKDVGPGLYPKVSPTLSGKEVVGGFPPRQGVRGKPKPTGLKSSGKKDASKGQLDPGGLSNQDQNGSGEPITSITSGKTETGTATSITEISPDGKTIYTVTSMGLPAENIVESVASRVSSANPLPSPTQGQNALPTSPLSMPSDVTMSAIQLLLQGIRNKQVNPEKNKKILQQANPKAHIDISHLTRMPLDYPSLDWTESEASVLHGADPMNEAKDEGSSKGDSAGSVSKDTDLLQGGIASLKHKKNSTKKCCSRGNKSPGRKSKTAAVDN